MLNLWKGRSNCFFFALMAWWRWRESAYIGFRLSRHITGIHWIVIYKNRIIHYSPDKPKPEWYKALFHKLWYKGKIKRTDNAISKERKKRL